MRRFRRSAAIAAILSFFVPGLGQLVTGAVARGVIVALPALATLIVAAGVLVLYPDPGYLAGVLLQPEALLLILALNTLLVAYHVGAILDAHRVARRRWGGPSGWRRLGPLGVATALVAATIGVHGTVMYVVAPTYDFVTSGVLGSSESSDGPDWGDEEETPAPGIELGGSPAPAAADDPTRGPSVSGPGVTSPLSPTPQPYPLRPDAFASAPPIPASPVGSSKTGDEQAPPGPAEPGSPIGSSPSPAPASQSPTAPAQPSLSPSAAPTPRPAPTRKLPYWARDGRLNLLIVGGDAGPDRWSLRTDTMILLSVDIRSGRAAFFGIPRNLVNVPLPPESGRYFPNGTFPGLLNALYVQAMAHPERFPGGKTRGYRAVSDAIGELTGAPIDGMVVADLGGFVRLIDALGGLWITVPERLYDRNYPLEDGSGWIVLDIAAGRQHFDGRMALAYARSRHQDSDYGRMERQQLVLIALRRQLKPCSLLPRLPDLVAIAKRSLWTNIPIRELPALLSLAARVDARRVVRTAFTPPRFRQVLRPDDIARIRRAVRTVFGGAPPAPPAGWDPIGGGC